MKWVKQRTSERTCPLREWSLRAVISYWMSIKRLSDKVSCRVLTSPLFTFFTSQATALLVVFEVNSLFQHCLDSFESVWIYFSLLVFENITECLNLKVEELCKKYLSFIIFDPFTYLELFCILSLCPDITPNPSILTKCSKDEAYAYYPVIVIIQVFWQNMCTKSWYDVIWYFDTAVI